MAIETLSETTADYSNHPNPRMRKGGDLAPHVMTREEMTAPLAWHEKQLGVCRRYGVLSDGSIGFAMIRDTGKRECQGHPAGPFDPMGVTVYCDGSCRA